MATITSANSSFALSITGLFTVPQFLQGYAADDAFTADSVDMAEVVMGVDGKLSAGYVFNPTSMTITLMPTSPSLQMFEAWVAAQKGNREVYRGDAIIRMPSIGRSYMLKNGYLKSAKAFPDNKKVLQAMPFHIVWETVIGAPI